MQYNRRDRNANVDIHHRAATESDAYLLMTGGHSLDDEGTYGVGAVVVAHFDEPVPLPVTTSPPVTGLMTITPTGVPSVLPAGTRVSVAADIYGVAVKR